ncbi:hypothetical protein [Aurantimonas sp. Leaf443]|uniref:hypothetical protein n=1 Tax=Aurantimonas sp. Leaf443 TaxID=1736378 RepID=UPI0007013359|nr:hypothetical protein [Aurantimonas sp. Leaf443]KQT82180.1 hypothetical protein ASG48_16200 [Aurantimonas sp. Leaf443]
MTRSTPTARLRPALRAALLGGALLAALPATAFAQGAPDAPAGPRMERGDGPKQHGGRHHGGPRRGPMMMAMMSPAKVAAALATLETGIGIRSDQMDAWRAFTGAAVAFAQASGPAGGMRPGMDRDARPASPPPAAGQTPPAPGGAMPDESEAEAGAPDEAGGPTPFAMIDRMADGAIERGQKAQALKTALDQLRGALTPEQVETAQGLVRSMMHEAHQDRGDRGGPGRHWRGGPDGERGGRGERPMDRG